MSDFYQYQESQRVRHDAMYQDYLNSQKPVRIVDWLLVGSLVGVFGVAAFFVWVSRW